jgi:hypothetical protein
MRVFAVITSPIACAYAWASGKPSLRLAGYLTLLSVFALLWATQRASASVTEQMLVGGRGLRQLLGALGNATTLRLNGHDFVLTSARTKRSVPDAIAEFGKTCVTPGGSQRFRVFNFQTTDTEAAAFCFAERGERQRPLLELAQAYAKTGELSELGSPRYLFARKERGHTVVVQVEAPQRIALDLLLPLQGDAAGADVPHDLKPAGAQRIVAASVADSPHGVAIYESTARLEDVLRTYVRQAEERGYSVRRAPSVALGDMLLLEKEGRIYVVQVEQGTDAIARLTSASLGASQRAVAEAAR